MNENTQDLPAKESARRRLIRGVFAAPAALTLYTGSAFAAASSACVGNQVSNPPSPLPVASGAPDLWVRVRLWTLGNGANLSTWVSGADVVALSASSATLVTTGTFSTISTTATTSTYLSSSEWQCFTAGSNSNFSVNQRLTSPPTRPGSTLTQNGAYVALRVDASGNIIGVVGIGSGGSTVSHTCWASFS